HRRRSPRTSRWGCLSTRTCSTCWRTSSSMRSTLPGTRSCDSRRSGTRWEMASSWILRVWLMTKAGIFDGILSVLLSLGSGEQHS
ncbi:Os01g0214400, partial [Oryza sativa Japonica Group]